MAPNDLIKRFLIIVLCLVSLMISAQNTVTFIITDVPSYTPKQDTLYLSSSIDNWQEASQSKRFKLFPDGNFRLTVDLGETKSFEYKINRGNWDKVEANNWGDYMANRKFTYHDSIFEIRLNVVAWQDLHHDVYPTIEVVVKEVPKNTPHDASIFLTGTFNNWIDNDETYKLNKQNDGTYVGKIPPGHDTILYKFIRGPWESIESRWDGGMRSNRSYIASQDGNHKIVAKINGWQDLSNQINWLKAIYLAFLIQGVLIITLLNSYSKRKVPIVLGGIVAFVFFIKYFYLNYNMLTQHPKGYLLPAALYGVVVVLGYIVIKNRITDEKFRFNLIYIIPLAFFIWYGVYLFVPSNIFFLNIVTTKYTALFCCSYGAGILLQQLFSIQLKRLINQVDQDTISPANYKLYIIYQYINVFMLIVVGGSVVFYLQSIDIKLVADVFEHLVWICIGVSMIYYQWFYFKSNVLMSDKKLNTHNKEEFEDEFWLGLKNKLKVLMVEKTVYLNPDLTLSDLAMHLHTNNQYVSRLINEGFKKSYTDFINDYRIEAFIELVKTDSNNETFLYHAYKVGFNSKSAFNRAFKKKQNTTPSNYFATLEKSIS